MDHWYHVTFLSAAFAAILQAAGVILVKLAAVYKWCV